MRNERGQSKGSAIIEFSSSQDAEYVVKALSGVEFENRQVYFDFQKSSSSSGGHGGGQGYSTGGFNRGGASNGGGKYYGGGSQ